MNIGRYDQKLEINEIQRISNGYGGYDDSYVPVASVFARIEQIQQSKRLSEVMQKLPTFFRVGIHFKAYTPTIDNVIKWEDEYYVIQNTPTRVNTTRNTQEWVFDIGKL